MAVTQCPFAYGCFGGTPNRAVPQDSDVSSWRPLQKISDTLVPIQNRTLKWISFRDSRALGFSPLIPVRKWPAYQALRHMQRFGGRRFALCIRGPWQNRLQPTSPCPKDKKQGQRQELPHSCGRVCVRAGFEGCSVQGCSEEEPQGNNFI